jgi:hypothetical protein
MENSNITVYDNGFGLVENSQPTSLIGFRDHINKRQELIEQLCNSLKVNINKTLDDYCEELRSCIEDKRSYMSVAYWWGSVATSEQEILQMIDKNEEIPQEAVDSLIQSFNDRCSSKIPYLDRAISALSMLSPDTEVSKYKEMLDTIKEKDRLIVDNLSQAATWNNVYVI